MIARIWHGWTAPDDADDYESLLRRCILPGIADRGIGGYRGAHLLRRQRGDEVEFVTVLWFDDLEAVRAFAGDDLEVAVVPPEARRLLARADGRAAHYDTVLGPAAGAPAPEAPRTDSGEPGAP